MANWNATKYPGVRYREHATRRSGNRPDRYFAIRYYGAQGKRHEEGVGWASDGWTAEQAAKVLGDIRSNVRVGVGPASLAERRELRDAVDREREARELEDRVEAITIDDVVKRYMVWAKANKRSWVTDNYWINGHILKAFGGMPFRAINAARMEKFKATLVEKKLAHATVRQIFGLVGRIFNFAAKTPFSEEIETPLFTGPNPCASISIPKRDNSRLRFFSRGDIDRILEAARDYPKHRRKGNMVFHDFCLLSLMTGMRKGEIKSLEWADVDLEHGTIHIRDAKSGDGIAHLNSDALAMLTRRKAEESPVGLVFKGARLGGQISNISHTFDHLAEELGLNRGVSDPRQRVSFHTLRHTFASWLALQGTDIYRIKELMRHKTISQTMRYAHLVPGATKDAVEALALHTAPSPPKS